MNQPDDEYLDDDGDEDWTNDDDWDDDSGFVTCPTCGAENEECNRYCDECFCSLCPRRSDDP